jgi:broad specificity phosphatase PhoE
MELIFIRHGETDYNKLKRKMGQRVDAELDATGIDQAKEVITKLPTEFSTIYSSPLKRAVQTAQVIADHFGKTVTYSDLLKERDFGSLSGKSWDQMHEETGKPIKEQDESLAYDYQPYGGESVEQVKDRLMKFLEEMKQKHEGETVLVVTHYGIIALMESMYKSKEHHKLTNASVRKFEIKV